MTSERLSDLFRPFLWLAVFAFFAGFSTYLMIGMGGRSVAASAAADSIYAPAAERSVVVPTPDEPWTFEKHV